MVDDPTAAAGCDCIAKVDAKLAEAGHNERVSRKFMLFPTFHDSGALVCTEKVDLAKRGRPRTLLATFCPFCGVRYSKLEKAPAHAD